MNETNNETSEVITPEVNNESQSESGVQNSETPSPESKKETQEDKTGKAFAEMRKQLKKFDGIDPDKYREMLSAEAKRVEDEKKRKGKYEELLNEKDEKLNSILPEYERLKAKEEARMESMTKELDEMMANAPEDQKSLIERVIEGKNVEDALGLTKELLKRNQKPDFKTVPKGGINGKDPNAYVAASQKGDVKGMLRNSRQTI